MMNLKSAYFYFEYGVIAAGKELALLLFGHKGEKLFSKYVIELFAWKNKLFHKSQDRRPGNDPGNAMYRGADAIRKKNITIIVPVYNAYEELQDCLESLISNTRNPYRLLLIDDASTDARIRPLLDAYEQQYPNVITLLNEKNLGYTATVNKGCIRAYPDDVVLLNSDTRVTRNWLTKLADCAQSDPGVATVTPLSNAAGAFSVPWNNIENPLPRDLTVEAMGELVERLSMKKRPAAPTGNGFCMYITRRALDAVGLFDVKKFPQGYGEENDFCMRAGEKGFVHVIDDSTFIYHKRKSSYREAKKKIISKSMRTLNILHPDYKFMVLKWRQTDPLDEFRAILQKELGKMQG
jgi:GT2 family glycosyltransferase